MDFLGLAGIKSNNKKRAKKAKKKRAVEKALLQLYRQAEAADNDAFEKEREAEEKGTEGARLAAVLARAAARVKIQEFQASASPQVRPKGAMNNSGICWFNALAQALVHNEQFTSLLKINNHRDDPVLKGLNGYLEHAKRPRVSPLGSFSEVAQAMKGEAQSSKSWLTVTEAGIVEDVEAADVVKVFYLLLLHLDRVVGADDPPPFKDLFLWQSQSVQNCESCGVSRDMISNQDTILRTTINRELIKSYKDSGVNTLTTQSLFLRGLLAPSKACPGCGTTTVVANHFRLGHCLALSFTYPDVDQLESLGFESHLELSSTLKINSKTFKLFAAVFHHGPGRHGGPAHVTTLIPIRDRLYHVSNTDVQAFDSPVKFETLELDGFQKPLLALALYERQ